MGRHSAPEPQPPRHRAEAEPDDEAEDRPAPPTEAPDIRHDRILAARVAGAPIVDGPAVRPPAPTVPAPAPAAVPATPVPVPPETEPPVAPDTNRSRRRRAGWVPWAAVVAVSVGIALVVRTYLLASFWIPSSSMEPTLHGCDGCNDDYVVVTRLSYKLHEVHRGDVIVFDKPAGVPDPDKYLIKRVIGLPGETISGHDGAVWIGDRPLRESYVSPQCGAQEEFPASTVPDGQVFVMGDNRCGSFDSRAFGTIAESSVVGRAAVIVWPVKRIHWL